MSEQALWLGRTQDASLVGEGSRPPYSSAEHDQEHQNHGSAIFVPEEDVSPRLMLPADATQTSSERGYNDDGAADDQQAFLQRALTENLSKVANMQHTSVQTLVQKHGREVAELRRQLQNARDELSFAKEEGRLDRQSRMQCEAELASVLKERDVLREERLSLTLEVNALQEKLEDKQTRLEVAQDHIVHLERAKVDLDRLRDYLAGIPSPDEYEDKAEAVEELVRECSELRHQLAQASRETGSQHERLADQDSTIADLRREVEELRESLLNTRQAQIHGERELRDVVKILQEERDELHRLYINISQELSQALAESSGLRQTLEAERQMHEEYKASAQERERSMSHLQDRLARVVSDKRELTATVEDLEMVKDELNRKVSAQAGTIESLRQSTEQMTEENHKLLKAVLAAGGSEHAGNIDDSVLQEAVERLAPTLSAGLEPRRTQTENEALQDALQAALAEFCELVDMANTRLQGGDPSLEQILGIAHQPAPRFTRVMDTTNNLETIRRLREKMAEWRQTIADQYASELGRDACKLQ